MLHTLIDNRGPILRNVYPTTQPRPSKRNDWNYKRVGSYLDGTTLAIIDPSEWSYLETHLHGMCPLYGKSMVVPTARKTNIRWTEVEQNCLPGEHPFCRLMECRCALGVGCVILYQPTRLVDVCRYDCEMGQQQRRQK